MSLTTGDVRVTKVPKLGIIPEGYQASLEIGERLSRMSVPGMPADELEITGFMQKRIIRRIYGDVLKLAERLGSLAVRNAPREEFDEVRSLLEEIRVHCAGEERKTYDQNR